MARIRTIKPSFWTDERVCAVPRVVRLTALGLISAMCDDEGRAKANPRVVRGAIYPLDDDLSAAEVGAHLDALERVGFIRRYRVNGECYLVVCNFLKHQKIDRPSQSQLPAPPGEPDTPAPDHSTNDRRAIDEPSTSVRAVVESSVVESVLAAGSDAREADRADRPASPPADAVSIAGVVVGEIAGAALRWTSAVNRGVADSPFGEQPNPIHHGGQHGAAERILAAGVDLVWGGDWLYHRAKASTERRKIPRSLAYLEAALVEAWQAKRATAEAQELAAAFTPSEPSEDTTPREHQPGSAVVPFTPRRSTQTRTDRVVERSIQGTLSALAGLKGLKGPKDRNGRTA